MEIEKKKIRAYCPNCYASPDKIVYQNSGLIVRIYCSECWIVYNDAEAHKKGFDSIIDFWNHIGIYMPQE